MISGVKSRLKCYALHVIFIKKSYWIPSKLRKWPTKPTKGVRYPKILNENEKEVEIFFELNSEADSENDHENDERL